MSPGAILANLPELDMSVSGGDEVVSVFRERNGLHFCRDLVGGHLDVVAPVPDVDDHVVLGPDGDDVLPVRRECLKSTKV